MKVICLYCRALKFPKESAGMCCSNGKVSLPPLNNPPEPLLSYVSGTNAISKHFLQNIRMYNSCFQMTSFGATVVGNGFMPTFKVQGQVYHRIGSLLPLPGEDAKFLQIYFTNNEEEQVNQLCAIFKATRREIIMNLQNLFHNHNNLVRQFKIALQQMHVNEHTIVFRADRTPPGEHERRYNAPTSNEVAAVIVGTDFERRDIIIHRQNSELKRVSETHRSYDALQYPILFWQGEDGYHFKIMQINSKENALGDHIHNGLQFHRE